MLMILSMAFLTGARPIFLLAFLNILLYQILAPLEERELLDQYGPQYEGLPASRSHGSCLISGGHPKPRFRPEREVCMIQRLSAVALVAL